MKQSQQIRTFIAVIKIVVQHVGGNLTLNQLLILAALWEADLKGNSLVVSDVANLFESTEFDRVEYGSAAWRFRDERYGFYYTHIEPFGQTEKLVRPSRQLMRLGESIVGEYAAYSRAAGTTVGSDQSGVGHGGRGV